MFLLAFIIFVARAGVSNPRGVLYLLVFESVIKDSAGYRGTLHFNGTVNSTEYAI